MSGYVPNPIVLKAIDGSHHNLLNIFLTNDLGYQDEILSQVILKNLSQGLHSYIIIPDESYKSQVVQILSKHHLAHLSIARSVLKSHDRDLIHNALTLENLRSLPYDPQGFTDSLQRKENIKKSLKSHFAFYQMSLNEFDNIRTYAVANKKSPVQSISRTVSEEVIQATINQELLSKYRILGELYQDHFKDLIHGKIESATFSSEEEVKQLHENLHDLKSKISEFQATIKSTKPPYPDQQDAYFRLTPFNNGVQNTTINHNLLHVRERSSEIPYLSNIIKKLYFSIEKLTDDITKLDERVTRLTSLVENDRLLNYLLLKNELQGSDELVSTLVSNKSNDWGQAFLQLYILANAQQKKIATQSIKNQQYNFLLTSVNLESYVAQAIHNLWSERRSKALAQSGFKTFKAILNSDDAQISVADGLRSVLNEYYPIQILSIDEIYKDISHELTPKSLMIFYLNKKINKKILSKRGEHIDSIIISPEIHNLNELKESNNTQVLKLDHSRLTETRAFKSLPTIERLKQAQSLAYAMYMISDRFDVIQLKHKSVILLCSKVISDDIIHTLPEDSINILYQDSSTYEDLIDAMIHKGREINVVIENGLIDERRLDHLQWQLHVMNLIEQAQINLIDIPTYELIIDYQSTITEVIDRILCLNDNKVSDLPISHDELNTIPVQHSI